MMNNEPLSHASARQFLEQAFHDLFDVKNNTADTVEKYMTPDYIQLVDGKTLDYAGFIKHLEVLLQALESINFTFENVIASKDMIADTHVVDAIKKDGSRLKTRVFAFFTIRDGKIAKTDELSLLIEGSEEDQDLASRV